MISLFREHQIFDNLIANQLCDELANALSDEGEFPIHFLLSGAAAYALQTEYTEPLKNIIFHVTTADKYEMLLNYLDKISARELIKYANRTYFKFPAGAIEICFMIMYDSEHDGSFEVYNGINIETISNINPEFYE